MQRSANTASQAEDCWLSLSGLLEVGCGSGIYIKRACELNPLLTAVGLEVQQSVADFTRERSIIASDEYMDINDRWLRPFTYSRAIT